MKDNTTTLTGLRDEDFAAKLEEMAANLRRRGLRPSADDIISAAMMSRPRQYYLSYNYILRRLNALHHDGFFDRNPAPMPGSPRAVWIEIDAKVKAYRLRHRRATIEDAVTHLVNFCSPDRFYISRPTARRIFRKHFRAETVYSPRKTR